MQCLPETPNRREAGSAFVIALLVLVVLSILGLSLMLVTAGENQVGANERMVNRVFYTADSGLAVAASRILVANDYSALTEELVFKDPTATSVNMSNTVRTGRVIPLLDAPCDLCQISNVGSYNEKTFRKMANHLTAEGFREVGATGVEVARKRVEAVLEMQPWETTTQAYLEDFKVAQGKLTTP